MSHNDVLTKDESQKQYLLQLVSSHRTKISVPTKQNEIIVGCGFSSTSMTRSSKKARGYKVFEEIADMTTERVNLNRPQTVTP